MTISAPAQPAREVSLTELSVTRLWCEVLDVSAVDLNDDFFEVGGTSLALTRVFDRIHRDLNAEVDVSQLQERVTIRDLAAAIDASRTARHESTPGGLR